MAKYKFTKEYDFRANAKMLYPYFTTINGLSEWFVEKIWMDEDKVIHFDWEGGPLKGIMKTHKVNSYVKYEFLPKEDSPRDEKPNFVEFKLVLDELTDITYLTVTDYSEMDDEKELTEMWDQFIHTLKEKVGG